AAPADPGRRRARKIRGGIGYQIGLSWGFRGDLGAAGQRGGSGFPIAPQCAHVPARRRSTDLVGAGRGNEVFMKLRSWFLLPARVWMALLFLAPLAIVLGYSFLTRGAYGGSGGPWTLENYQRLADPLYLVILLRSFWMALLATLLCLVFAFP